MGEQKSNSGSLKAGTVKYFDPNLKRTHLLLGLLWLASILFLIKQELRPVFYVFTAILFTVLASCFSRRFIKSRKSAQNRIKSDDEFDAEYLKNLTGLPTIFTYEAMDTATRGFSNEIGRGGFGIVYEGILSEGTPVALKCLMNRDGQGQREFCAEIATISSINHSNLVTLRGLCVEGQHRILVYEFMANGSLDKWLFGSDKLLDWKTRYSIALETARGLAYLHEDSRLCILHLDIKPQNILLDENFKAKVSDFGMAKCLDRDMESAVVTEVRGTAGYMAREWIFEQGITSKSDVFSYGMVLLEIISGRKNVDNSQDSDHWFFPSIAFRKTKEGKMEELIDSRLKLKTAQDWEQAYRVIKTALWCIQSNSALRPSMGTVMRILEGDLEIMDPPGCRLPFAPAPIADDTRTMLPAEAGRLEILQPAWLPEHLLIEVNEVELASQERHV